MQNLSLPCADLEHYLLSMLGTNLEVQVGYILRSNIAEKEMTTAAKAKQYQYSHCTDKHY